MTYDAEQMRMHFLEAVKPSNYCLHEYLSTWDGGTDGRSFDVDWVCGGERMEAAFWEDSGDSVVFCLAKYSRHSPQHLLDWDGSAGEEPPGDVIEAVRTWLEKWSAVVAGLSEPARQPQEQMQ